MKSTSTLSGKLRNLKVIIFILISCTLLTLNYSNSYAQVRNYATIAPSNGAFRYPVPLLGPEGAAEVDAGAGSVTNPGNAATGNDATFATINARFFSLLGLGGFNGEGWLQLKFPQPVAAGTVTYIRFDQPATTSGIHVDILKIVGDLTGLIKTELVKFEAYSGASAASNGTLVAPANVQTTVVQDINGVNYFAVTSMSPYNSVRIKLSAKSKLLNLSLGAVMSMNVYEAFTIAPGAGNCGTAVMASNGESSGVNVSLTPLVTNPARAADGDLGTFSQIQGGLVAVGSTVSQMVFFNQTSDADAVAKVSLSIPPSILTLNLFNEIKLQAFNGNTPVGLPVSTSSLLGGLDLLGLFSNSKVVPVFYTPGAAFDRVQVSLANAVGLGGNLIGGGLNLHEIQFTVAKPQFAGLTNGALTGVCGNNVNLSVATPNNNFTYTWYRKSGTSKIQVGTTTTGTFTEQGVDPGNYMYYVSAQKTACPVESDLDSATVTVTAIPTLPIASAAAICSGSAGIFTVTNAESGVVYKWYTNPVAAVGDVPVYTGSTITTTPLTANTTYYVEGSSGTCVSASRTAVTITVSDIPADAQVFTNNVIITTGQTATLTATAPTAGSTINWYTASTGGVAIATGSSFSTPVLTSPTTYFVGTLGAGGCPSVNRVAVTVTVTGVSTGLNCKTANAQTNGVEGLLCVGCGIADPTFSADAISTNFSAIHAPVNLLGAVYQRLIFPAAGIATDSIRLSLAVPTAIADVSVLGGITVNVMNGNNIVSTYQLNSGLINLELLQDNKRFEITVPAGAIYDRVELRLSGVVQALTTLHVYGAEVIYPNPVISNTGLSICSGTGTTLSATPVAGTTLNWYANASGGTALASGNTYSPTGLTASTTYYVEVTRGGCANTARVPVTVTVNPAIVFATTTLNNATIGSLYAKQITAATGGTPAFTYTLAPGSSLPAGLSLSTTGVISGTPASTATPNDYNFSILAQDSKGCSVLTAFSLKLTAALSLAPATLPNGIVTVIYPNQPLPLATGGTGPYTYTATNTPPGLTFNNQTPGISGTPTLAGTYPVRVTVTDVNGNTKTQDYTIVVKNPLVLPAATLANGTVGINYPAQKIPEATGGTGPYTYAATGLAPGQNFNISTREVTGVPTAAGPYTVLVTVTDAEGKTATNTYPLTIGPALVLPPATLANGNVGVAYTPQTIPSATGGTSPYTYAAVNVPANLNFDPITRVISGTPAQSGLYTVSVTVTDNVGTKATNTYALRIIGALSLPSATLADGTVGTTYPPVVLPAVSGGTGPYTYTFANLPAGMTFNPSTRTLSGTPTVGGTFTFQITAKDAGNNTTTTDFVLKVKVGQPVVASTSICAGTTGTLSVTNLLSGVTYKWYGATGSTAIFTGNSFTTPALTATTTYYVEAVSGTAVSDRTPVTVTVRPAPNLAQVTVNQIISAGQTATLQATADAGNTISWFSNSAGGIALATGGSFTTPVLNTPTTYYIETQNASGCVSATRVPVIVTVTGIPTNTNCNAATAQQTAIDGLCVLCGITNAGGSTDANPATFTSIHLTVGVGAIGYQRLIFANPGTGTDSIRLDLGFPVALADLSVLGGATVTVYNGTTIVKSYPLNSSLVHLALLNPNRLLATFSATGVYDRVEIRFGALVSALSTLDIYGATVIYPNPTVAATGQSTCAGSTTTLTATANGGTTLKWYATANSGTALGTGSTFTTPVLNATTTYYIEVSKGTCANAARVPVTVTVTPAPTAPVLATVLPVCYGSTASLTVNNAVAELNYNWYTVANGGTSIFTGSTFVSPALVANTTYYVEAISPGCGGSSRTAVPVTVNPIVSLPQVLASATTVNAGQTVILTISPVLADISYNWYTSANGTTPVYTGPTYVTPPLSVNTTYYVEAKSNLTGCVSSSRVQLTINVNNGGNPNPVPCESAKTGTDGVTGVAILAGVFNPALAFDNDTQTGSSLLMPVGALGATVYQRLSFGSVSTVGDTVKVLLNTPGKLLSLGLLSNIQIGTYNGATNNNDAVSINNNLVNLQLLSGDTQALLTFVPTVPFDQVEVRLNAGLAGVLSSVNLNYAQRIVLAPTLVVPNPTACAGQPVTLTVKNPNPSIVYKWYDATGATELATGTTYSPTLTGNTSFLVSANTLTCSSYKTKVSVTVTPIPDAPVLAANNINTCSGSNVVLAVKDPITGVAYRWYATANPAVVLATGPTFTIQNVTASASYSVEAFLTACSTTSATKTTATITLGALDKPIVVAASLTIVSGTPAVLTASSSTSGVVFSWYSDAALTTLVSNLARFQTPPLINNGVTNLVKSYFVTAAVPGGCVSEVAEVNVTILPEGVAVDAPCELASVQVRSGVDGVGVLTGVFNPERAVDNNANSASSLVMPVGILGASVYQHVGFTSLSSIGDTVRIRMTSPGKLLKAEILAALEVTTYNKLLSNNDVLTVGGNPLITVDLLTGDENLIISFVPQKQFDGVELRLRSGLAAVLSSVDLNYVQRIQIAPKVASATVSACVGTGAVLSVLNPDAAYTYKWYIGTAATSVATGATYTTANNLAVGAYSYYVTATRNNCESAKTKVSVTVLAAPGAPVAIAGNPKTTCLNATATLAVTNVAGVTYNWYDALTTGNLLAANTASYTTTANLSVGVHDFFVEAVNANSCVSTLARTKITITVNPSATPADIKVTGADLAFCSNTKATLTASSNGTINPKFAWYTNADLTTQVSTNAIYEPIITANTTFYVTVFGDNLCLGDAASAKVVSIVVNPPATANDLKVTGADAPFCAGAKASLMASSTGIDNPIYVWYSNAALTTEVFRGPLYEPTVAQNTILYVSVSGDNKCPNLPNTGKVVAITVNTPATAADITVTGNGAPFCAGTKAKLTATSTAVNPKFIWYSNAGLTTEVFRGPVYEPTVTASTTFYVSVSGDNKCPNVPNAGNAVVITVNTPASAADINIAGNNANYCKGSTASLRATSTTVNTPVFTWYNDVDLTDVAFSGPLFEPVLNATTTYYVTVSGTNKCENVKAGAKVVTVVVNPPALASDITVAGNNAPFCNGTKALLTASSAITSPVFTWYSNAALTIVAANGPVFEPVVTATTTYYVTVSGPNRCQNAVGDAKIVTLIVNTPATATDLIVSGGGATVCDGSSVKLTAASTTVSSPVFTWYADANLTNAVFTGPVLEKVFNTNTTYYVTVKGANKCENLPGTGKVVTVKVNSIATAADINVAGNEAPFCAGAKAVLTANSLTISNPVFIWYSNAALTNEIFRGAKYEPIVTVSTTFYVTVSGDDTCPNAPLNGKALTIVVNTPTKATDITVNGNNAPFCTGTKALLSASSSISSPVFTWYKNANLTDVAFTGPVFEPVVSATTTYYVTATGANNCKNAIGDAKVVTLVVNTPATAANLVVSGAEAAVCEGTSVKLTASSTNVNTPVFTWYTDADLTDAVFTGAVLEKAFTTTTTYYVSVKGTDKCENLPGTGKMVTVTVNPLPEVPVIVNGAGAGLCAGDAATLSVQSPRTGTTYQWYDAATGGTLLGSGSTLPTGALSLTKDYYLLATNTSGCGLLAGRVKVTVIVNVKPAVPLVVSAAVNTCSGSTVVLSIASPVNGITYNWYSTPTGGTSVGSGVNFTVGPFTNDRTFYAEAATATCRSNSRTAVVVKVLDLPTAPSAVSGATDPFCTGNTSVLTVNNPDPALTYRWYDVEVGGTHLAEGNSFTTPALAATATYYVGSVNTLTGCVSSNRTAVTVTILPKLTAPVVSVRGATATSVTFGWAAVSGARGYEVSVDGGNTWLTPSAGLTGTTHTIEALKPDQEVAIRVRATGQLACQLSDASSLNSKADNPIGNQVFVPNTFTPNSDGKNDVLYVYGNAIAKMKLRVYNQWGQFLFESNNIQNGWDGTYKGEVQPNGVYVYQFEAEMNDGTKTTKKGTITLLR